MQEVHSYDDVANMLRPTAWVVSGGGGGITSAAVPRLDGEDDAYGFIDLTLNRSEIIIESISHGGQVRSTATAIPREPHHASRSSTSNFSSSSSNRTSNGGITPNSFTPAVAQAATTGISGFSLIKVGSCASEGMLALVSEAACNKAAVALGLKVKHARPMTLAGWADGCFYTEGPGVPALWVAADPRVAPEWQGRQAPVWHEVCQHPEKQRVEDLKKY